MRHSLLAALVVAVAVSQGAGAEEAGRMVLVPNDAAVKWQAAPANLPKGSQLAVLAGDPGKPGPFALRVKFPPNTLVAPHRHAIDENLTVISGELYHGMGEAVERRMATRWTRAGLCTCPAAPPTMSGRRRVNPWCRSREQVRSG